MILKFGPELKKRCTKAGVNREKLASILKFGLEIKNRCTKEGVNGDNLAVIPKSGPEIKNRCRKQHIPQHAFHNALTTSLALEVLHPACSTQVRQWRQKRVLMRPEAAFPYVSAAEGAQHPPKKLPRSTTLPAVSFFYYLCARFQKLILMWLGLAFLSALLLGFYDVSKKAALKDNAVIPVLLLNTVFETLIFSPFILDSIFSFGWFSGGAFDTTACQSGVTMPLWRAHLLLVAKSAIVLSSWICGYMGLKHLPITIVGPINSTRPVLVLLGAMLIFGERLNLWQWTGVLLAIVSVFLLGRSSRREKIDFTHNRWVAMVALATILGAISGLYDRFLMRQLSPMFVQSWYVFYQMLMMGAVLLLLWFPNRRNSTPFHWNWAIVLISLFISLADVCYLTALKDPSAMISVISLIRRGSVVVSFLFGAMLFHEKNLRAKAFDLFLILLGMLFIWIGSR